MPAHIGVMGNLKMGLGFIAMNMSLAEGAKRTREGHGGHVAFKAIKHNFKLARDRREMAFTDYESFRRRLNLYDPHRVLRAGEVNMLKVDETEWDLYLKPDTAFDINCRRYFEVFRNMTITLVGHKGKGEASSLKRIEAHPQGERMRILWSD